MQKTLERTVLAASREGHAWQVECDGHIVGHASNKQLSMAHAHQRALEAPRAVQMPVQGEGNLR
jgi:hypothetical protein